MDVVYLFKEDKDNDSQELRYSLRSLQNIPHNKVYIVGEKPGWAVNVVHIPVAQLKTKSQNVMSNLVAAIESPHISDDFIMMNDDFFFMKKLREVPNLNFGDMHRLIKQYRERYPEGSEYIDKMAKLYEALVAQGCEKPISYELHTPMIINKQKASALYKKTKGPLYQFRTLYGNSYKIGGVAVDDTKIFIEPRHNHPLYNQNPSLYLEQKELLSVTGGAFKRGFAGEFIRNKFPEKSIYER